MLWFAGLYMNTVYLGTSARRTGVEFKVDCSQWCGKRELLQPL